MQQAVTLAWNGQVMRGMEHIPETGNTPCPAVLINHGFTGHKGGSHRIHVHISRALEAIGTAAVRYDFIGSGESDGEFDEMTLSSEIEQAHAVYQAMCEDPRIDTERIFVLGHSMGGVVAARLCGDLAAAGSLPAPRGLILMAPAGNMLPAFEEAKGNAPDRVRDDGSVDHAGFLVSAAFHEDLKAVMPGLPARAAAYTGPVHIIHGTVDEAVPLETGREFSGYYREPASLHAIEGADHSFADLGHEAELIREIVRFVGDYS